MFIPKKKICRREREYAYRLYIKSIHAVFTPRLLRSVQSEVESTLSDKEILASKNSLGHAQAKGGLTLSQTINFRLFQTERVCRRQFQI